MKHSEELRQKPILRPLFRIRDGFMEITGLFKLKAKIKNYFFLKRIVREDELRKKQIAKQICELPSNMLTLSAKSPNVVVSMTSYGERVNSSAAYALYSILTQKQLPNRIVLNLDQERWNNENIPQLLKHLQRAGVEINFCEDVGPHTKLLPALRKFPNDIIITTDDDIYYDDTLVSELFDGFNQSDKRSVICRDGKYICKHNGAYLPYSRNPHCNEKCNDEIVSVIPFGVGGVLYPPHVFSDEIFNKDVFRELCRFADDVWFGIMELRECINIIYLRINSRDKSIPVDREISYSWTDSRNLMFLNDTLGKNDEQYAALLKYYKM